MAVQGGYDLTLVGYELEATFGTDPAAGRIRWPGIVTSLPNPTEDFGKTVVRGLGAGRDPGQFYRTKKEIGLTVESLLNHDDTGDESIFGLALGSAPASGVITPTDTLRSFALETGLVWGGTDWFEKYTGCRVENLSLSCNEGEAVTLTTEIIAKDLTRAGTETNATADKISELVEHTTQPFTMQDVTVTFGSAGTQIVRSLTLDINNTLSRIYGLSGSDTIAELFATTRDVTGSMTVVKQTDTLLNKFLADPFNNSENITIALSKNSGAELVTIVLTGCRVMSRDFSRPGDEVKELEEAFDFQAASIAVTIG